MNELLMRFSEGMLVMSVLCVVAALVAGLGDASGAAHDFADVAVWLATVSLLIGIVGKGLE